MANETWPLVPIQENITVEGFDHMNAWMRHAAMVAL